MQQAKCIKKSQQITEELVRTGTTPLSRMENRKFKKYLLGFFFVVYKEQGFVNNSFYLTILIKSTRVLYCCC
jgi:hypothetical protein